ncbi:baculoviral IAP repeat-containing protein 3-like [Anneissia japonica]|uniref:baculoviral IAP repeat-containing protein 3-like n=1 Tax=Anneissia japonica TaxID=1529436 RepID=UPI0014255A22|nr:baculoviral IAP repeat-containing protein 3-like [Anneissia japonica]
MFNKNSKFVVDDDLEIDLVLNETEFSTVLRRPESNDFFKHDVAEYHNKLQHNSSNKNTLHQNGESSFNKRSGHTEHTDINKHEWNFLNFNDVLDMSILANRLSTFKNFSDTNISPRQLANDGYFYDGRNLITCSSCDFTIVLTQLRDAALLHEIQSPNCEFIKKYKDERRIRHEASDPHNIYKERSAFRPVPQSAKVISDELCEYASNHYVGTEWSRNTSNYFSRPTELSVVSSPEPSTAQSAKVKDDIKSEDDSIYFRDAMINKSAARFSGFSNETSRLATFSSWPHAKPDKWSIAMAGFFYQGFGDHVKCFYCGLALDSWEPNDDPFYEHAKFADRCTWLEYKKGKNFIAESKKRHGLVQQGTTECGIKDLIPNDKLKKEEDSRQVNVDDVLITSRVVKNAFELGFEEDVIKAVVKRHLEDNKGIFAMSNDDMIDQILNYEPNDVNVNVPLSKDAENEIANEFSKLQFEEKTHNASQDVPSTASEEPQSTEAMLKQLEDLKDQQACKVCLNLPANIVFRPCNHLVTCEECGRKLNSCPICREKVKDRIKIFQS